MKDRFQYYKTLQTRSEMLNESDQQIAKAVIGILRRPYYNEELHSNKLEGLLSPRSNSKTTAFFEPLVPVVTQLLGEYQGNIIKYIIQNAFDYPYSSGYYRRPFRTANSRQHLPVILGKVVSLLELYQSEFDVISYLSMRDYDRDADVISDIIAFEIDQGNEQVIQALRDIIYGDNNTALLSRTMVKGIFLSHNREMYTMLGELLVAAKLQEGLRQSIVESMDQGTLEATVHILKIIIDHNLIRYSSVIRALDVWTGLELEAANKRVASQNIEYIYHCLTEEQRRREYLEDENAKKIYISLWATAVRDEMDLEVLISDLMENGADYQKAAALHLLNESQNETLRFQIAHDHLKQENLELQYLVVSNYPYGYSFPGTRLGKFQKLESKNERLLDFTILKKAMVNMPKKEVSIRSSIHDHMVTYTTDDIADRMIFLIEYDMDRDWIAELFSMKDSVSADQRWRMLDLLTSARDDSWQREMIFKCLSDRSMAIRESALSKIKKLELTHEEIEKVASLLKLKTGSLRQGAIRILLGLEQTKLEPALESLLTSKNELQRLAALEIISKLSSNREPFIEKLTLIKEPTHNENILLSKLTHKEEYTWENGYGLIDGQEKPIEIAEVKPSKDFTIKGFLTLSESDIKKYLSQISDAVHQQKDHEYEFEWSDGFKETTLIGSELRPVQDNNGMKVDALPLPQVWRNTLQNSGLRNSELLQLEFYLNSETVYKYYFNQLEYWEMEGLKRADKWKKSFIAELYPIEKLKEVYSFLGKLPYPDQVLTLISAFAEDSDNKERFSLARDVISTIINAIPKEKLSKESRLLRFLTEQWNEALRDGINDDTSFRESFFLKYKLYASSNYRDCPISLEEFARALDLQLIDQNALYREIIGRKKNGNMIREITEMSSELQKKYPVLRDIRDQIIDRILGIELKRGDLKTEVTELTMDILSFEGIDYFVQILTRLGREPFVRGYYYGYGENITKKDSFSHLLQICHPKENEDEKDLGRLLQEHMVSEKRLLEAAMYAPQWIDIISRYLQWDGLRSAVWYFHAHINEAFSAEKETIVAHYSPIPPVEFNDGSFDIDWFNHAYSTLGEERFSILYDCAKYISTGSRHRRAQLFADAVLGKLKPDELKKSAKEKRNKDHLLSYCLIPLKEDGDVLERYEFIHEFLRESKQFGAQRRASEAKTVSIALDNLARNAGYKDALRMQWALEAKKMKEINKYLEPKAIDDLTVQLVINEDGKADIMVSKKGKQLKSTPAKYKKHEYIVELANLKKDLRNQYSRAKQELEQSMENASHLSNVELKHIAENPVVAPLIAGIVFRAGSELGFYNNGVLVNLAGERYSVKANDEIVIAHPVDLFDSGTWSDFQKYFFDHQIQQPFKQVFRELYLPNEDEIANGTLSYRYAGHQVQPRKTTALLKNRKWTVDYEDGLQKVYYKENIIAKVYAMADWFSPSDIEYPTLETVEFYKRNTYERLKLETIPKRIFSETMRDLDLVVSVAHAGGVDPEASLSTIEMRIAIVNESLKFLKLDNVTVEKKHALIKGTLGDYSVHLGSGTVFKQAAGALNIIPVHSQHRGRIFLPFLDEDPKTAEILSKIILLAQDTKIKDPYILEQM
ncbi:DUF4132 domain-containing protein [Bacillus sp. V5-8f]|uniref:DUF4132 domain-containing protein n=1 Tax=Bacillus sp. V5-8f TaxID=2053044 RepID=UPI002155D520|nr:DUF4132 domain-containing protein [Bacillus sp. V5-8f]